MNYALYECHGHLLLDGADFKAARARHAGGVDLRALRANLAALRDAGVTYYRDGGDPLGVSLAARVIALEYGVQLATPAFAIHRKGHYGAIVGRGYADLSEYRALVTEAEHAGCDFIKLMFSGILTFRAWGELSCPGLETQEIADLVACAHDRGLAVMAHVNGAETVRAAIAAGTDSIEHGYFMDEETLAALAASDTIWVPTIAATAAFIGRPGFDRDVAEQVVERQMKAVRTAASLGAHIASGSDAGAAGVPHGSGIQTEYRLLTEAGVDPIRLAEDNELLRRRFRR